MPPSCAYASIEAKFRFRELEIIEGRDILTDLLGAARTDKGGGYPLIAQDPCQSHLCEALPSRACDFIERPDPGKFSSLRWLASTNLLRAALIRASSRHPMKVFRGEHSLGERREGDAPDSLLLQSVEQFSARSNG